MRPVDLMSSAGEWLRGTGPSSDIVISSRVRLARNMVNYPFLSRMKPPQRREAEEKLRTVIAEKHLVPHEMYFDLYETEPLERKMLVERHLISREHEDSTGRRGVAVSQEENISIMVLEEDHLRIQVLRSGLNLKSAWDAANRIDDIFEEQVEYAFDEQLGYLTACPTNVGTGLRVSVMLHLPALVITRQIEKVFHAVSKINLAVRGLYGEGTEAHGHFYQISNQVTLGRSETQIIENVEAVIPQIVRFEESARKSLLEKDRRRLEDRVWRAYGMLKYARVVSSEETMTLLSALRLGVHLGLISEIPVGTVNELFIYTQPAHLQLLAGTDLEPLERDQRRADYVRERLGEQN
jgi:protein arginine kinase